MGMLGCWICCCWTLGKKNSLLHCSKLICYIIADLLRQGVENYLMVNLLWLNMLHMLLWVQSDFLKSRRSSVRSSWIRRSWLLPVLRSLSNTSRIVVILHDDLVRISAARQLILLDLWVLRSAHSLLLLLRLIPGDRKQGNARGTWIDDGIWLTEGIARDCLGWCSVELELSCRLLGLLGILNIQNGGTCYFEVKRSRSRKLTLP